MKIRLFSDLHLEFSDHSFDHVWVPSDDDADMTLLLAGDIDVGLLGQEFIQEACRRYKHVLRICGNHEFYHNDYTSVINGWKQYEESGPSNFHFLYNDWRILDGVRFLGGTMWTSLNDGDFIVRMSALSTMNDFEYITSGKSKITPDFVISEHDKFIKFLLTKFEESFDGPTVVMTHHSPGNIIKCQGRIRSNTDYAYFAEIDDMIGHHNKADLWVHGHTHDNFDYMINETRVVCNPYGYHGTATNPDFNANIVLVV
jgi:predicted phosphodiesterase